MPRRQNLADTSPLRSDLEERRTGRELLKTAFEPPSTGLLEESQRTFIPVAPDSDLPDSHTRRAHGSPVYGAPLPPDAPDWMVQARELVIQLEGLIQRGLVERHEHLAVTRSVLAFKLVNSSQDRIAKVAHLVHRAHNAIRTTNREHTQAMRDCAEILFGGLPTQLRRVTAFDHVLDVMRSIADEADPWVAVVEGTSRLLGWQHAAMLQSANAIRTAIEDRHLRQRGQLAPASQRGVTRQG